MAGRNIFRDEAMLSYGQPEALDGLARVDPPHQFVVSRSITVLIAGVLFWILLGETDHSLWLEGQLVPIDASRAAAIDFQTGVELDLYEHPVAGNDTERLSPGAAVELLPDAGSELAKIDGVVHSIFKSSGTSDGEESGQPNDPRLIIGIPSIADADIAGNYHRLRIPIGRQSLLQFLLVR